MKWQLLKKKYYKIIFIIILGEMAERFKAHAWKVCVLLKVPWVRIPLSPPSNKKIKLIFFYFYVILNN